jgi:hypothetical protein
MTTEQAIDILRRFNAWRRGEGFPVLDVAEIGNAIDHAIKAMGGIAARKTDRKTCPKCGQMLVKSEDNRTWVCVNMPCNWIGEVDG